MIIAGFLATRQLDGEDHAETFGKQDRPAATSFAFLKDDWMTLSDLMHADCVQYLL